MYNNYNSGYSGYSMSKRAVKAYSDGEKPISKFSKSEILDNVSENYPKKVYDHAKTLSKEQLVNLFLKRSSWHHTSSRMNKTIFYSFNDGVDSDYVLGVNKRKVYREKPTKKRQWALVKWTQWLGTRSRPKPKERVSIATWEEKDGVPGMVDLVDASEKKQYKSIVVLKKLKRKPNKKENVWKFIK